MTRHTYQHRFPNGIVATAVLSTDPTGCGVEWSRQPGPEVLCEYLAWRATILDEFTKRTGQKILIVTV